MVEQHGIRVLIIHGQEDILVPVANSRRMARTLPGARLVEFERCGHMPQVSCVHVSACVCLCVCMWVGGRSGLADAGLGVYCARPPRLSLCT